MKKQIKVAYFPPEASKDKVLGSNGKSLDRYCIKSETEEDLSTGNYIVDLKFLITDNIQDLLQEEVILKVLMDYGNEIFRISKVTVGTRYIDVVARQITIADSLTSWLEDVRPTNLNGQAAVSWMLDRAEGKKEIQIISDIDTINTAYYQRMSLYKALHDNDNSFLNRWGGEIQRRGYTVYINKRVGIDRGFTIREGKNLTGFECTSNIDNLVTRARGEGYNGILGNYIDSPLIGSYNHIYTSVIKYEDVKVKDEYSDEGYDTLEEAQAELDRRINEEFSNNDIDKIKASYTINFVQLEKTEEYKNYIPAERLFIGDDSRVYIPKLNVDIKVRAMIKKYDVLAQKTKEIKLSNYIEAKPLSIKQITEKLESMDSTETILQLAKDNATSLIKGGLKNSYVIVRENEILIMDTQDINTATNVWRWNSGGLGHSNTGYYGTYGTAITQDGAIVADFITTGILNADLIKTGILQSFNGNTTLNMTTGKFSNVVDGYGIDVERGGMTFNIENETVGGIRSSRFESNNAINGMSIANTKNGDYTEIGFTESENFDGSVNFKAAIRISKIEHELMKKFKGIQIFEQLLLADSKTFYIQGNDEESKNYHELYNTIGGQLAVFGGNGLLIGYKTSTDKVTVFEISEQPNTENTQVFLYRPLSMFGNNIKYVPNIYTGNTTGRYYHEGWNGSIEKVAKRISNLNLTIETGLYSFTKGAQGAPCDYGTLVHIKWTSGDIADCSQLVIELITGKLYTRATNQDASMWIAWQEK